MKPTVAAFRRHMERPARLQRRSRYQQDRLALCTQQGGPRFRDEPDYEIRIVGHLGRRGLRAS